jgi:drug/metabolite transporter (DMT)-like permease
LTELLALGSAVAFGTGDFMGGYASRRDAPLPVTATAQLASVVVLIPLVALVPAPNVAGTDLAWGAGSGLFGMIGIMALFTGFARGPMGIIAPITAVIAALVPVLVGIVGGERPGSLAVAGMVVGLGAVVAVSAVDTPSGPVDRYAVLAAIVAGFGFGLFFAMLGQTSSDSGMWPLVTARAVSVPLIVLVAHRSGRVLPVRSARGLASASGSVDMVANGLFTAAAQRGLLSVASVLTALYPVVTAILAWVVLRERLRLLQQIGVAAAVVAVAMIGLAP